MWFTGLTKFKIFSFLSFFFFTFDKIIFIFVQRELLDLYWFDSRLSLSTAKSTTRWNRKYLNETDKSRYARRKGGEWLWLTTLAPDSRCHDPWTSKNIANNVVDDFSIFIKFLFRANAKEQIEIISSRRKIRNGERNKNSLLEILKDILALFN